MRIQRVAERRQRDDQRLRVNALARVAAVGQQAEGAALVFAVHRCENAVVRIAEFQALLEGGPAGVAALMRLMPGIVERARPLEVRFGLGLGELSTDLQPRALGIDGPCFHRAREALTRARDNDLLCQLETGAAGADAVWGALASYALRARTGWTEPQRSSAIGERLTM